MTISLGDIAVYFKGDLSGLDTAIDRAERTATAGGQRIENALSSPFQNIGGRISTFLGGAVQFAVGGLIQQGVNAIGAGFASLGGSVIGFNSDLETATAQFKVFMGDADAARAHVADLFQFAKSTPFETGPIIEASRFLRLFGGDALDTQQNLTRVGDAAAAVSAPIEEVSFWVGRAYAAIQGGQPFGEARERLQELAILSPQAASALEGLSEAGAAPADMLAILNGELDRFGGAMVDQAGLWSGLTSTLADTLNIVTSTALRPFFDLAKQGLTELNAMLGSDAVTQWAQNTATSLQSAITYFLELGQRALPYLINGFNALAPIAQSLSTIISGLGSVLADVASIAYDWGSGLIAQYANGIADGVGWVADALAAVAETVAYWLEPQSPPRILPDIDKWGLEAAELYMRGWEDPALFDGINSFGDTLGTALENLADAGKAGGSVPTLLLGSRAAFADALNELERTGNVSEATFARIRDAAGGAGDVAERLARAYVATAKASQQLQAAQRGLLATNGQLEAAQAALLTAEEAGDRNGIAQAQNAIAAAKAQRDAAQQRVAGAKQQQQSAQAQISKEEQVQQFQRDQLDLLRQIAEAQERATAASEKAAATKKGETPEERAARQAKEAQEKYNFALLDTQGKIDYLKAKQGQYNQSQKEYWEIADQIRQLEAQKTREQEGIAREQERIAKQQQRDQETAEAKIKAVADAQWAHAYAIADTATKLQMQRDKLGTLNEGQAEYYQTLTQIDQLEKQLAREREAEAKKAAGRAKGAGGRGGAAGIGGGVGGIRPPTIRRPEAIPRRPIDTTDMRGDDWEKPAKGATALQEALRGIGDAVSKIVNIPGILGAIGGALAAIGAAMAAPVITGAISAIGAALAFVVSPIGLLIAGAAALGAAWATDFGGIRTATMDLWTNTLQPVLSQLISWIGEQIPKVISFMAGVWENVLKPVLLAGAAWFTQIVIPAIGMLVTWLAENIPIAIQKASGFWTNVLGPALDKIWQSIQTHIVPIFMEVAGWLRDQLPGAIQVATDFWTGTLQPALATIWAYIQSNILPILGQVVVWLGDNIPVAIKSAADFWNTILKPALSDLWGFLKTNVIPTVQDAVTWLGENIPKAMQAISDFWNDTLSPALTDLATFFKTTFVAAANTAKGVIDGIKRSFEYVSDAISDVIDWLKDLADKWKSMKPPDWITGQSPPPLADWFSYVADATRDATGALDGYDAGLRGARPPSGAAAFSGTAGGLLAGVGGLTVNGPLIGSAVIREDADIPKLAYQLAKEIRKRQE